MLKHAYFKMLGFEKSPTLVHIRYMMGNTYLNKTARKLAEKGETHHDDALHIHMQQ